MTIRPAAAVAAAIALAVLALIAPSAGAAPTAGSAVQVLSAPRSFLDTAVLDPAYLESDSASLFARTSAAGASTVRLLVQWASIAPGGASKPEGFDAANPEDSHYGWGAIDAAVQHAVAHRLRPVLDVVGAPAWAQKGQPPRSTDGPYEPIPSELAAFATAAATRYDGRHGLPRVRYWQAWNEPNGEGFLTPLFTGRRLAAPGIYRGMLNAFAAAVHGVRPDNVVVAGALSPFTITSGGGQVIGPMAFMRSMLCMSAGAHPHPTCKTKSAFDVWAIQPYTSGDAFHKANNTNDVSLGDLAKMRSLLVAAAAAGHVVAAHPVRLWVTELAWDTNPPDTNSVPITLQSRWTAEGLWQCWRNGVELVTWFMLRDQPFPSQPFQSGLYFINDKPKPTLTAFRFPFVAYPRGGRTYVWGRTPDSKPHAVAIMHKLGYLGYQRVAVVHANRHGIFQALIPFSAKVGFLHAQIGKDKSLDFSLKAPPDRFVHPFG